MYIKKLLFDKIFFLTFVIRMGTLAGLPRRERSSTKTSQSGGFVKELDEEFATKLQRIKINKSYSMGSCKSPTFNPAPATDINFTATGG